MTWEFLVILGVVLLLTSPVGDWLAGLVREASTHHDMKLSLNPFDKTTASGSGSGGSGGSSSNSPIGHFDIPLEGGGAMNVNAHSLQDAIGNVASTGAHPAIA